VKAVQWSKKIGITHQNAEARNLFP